MRTVRQTCATLALLAFGIVAAACGGDVSGEPAAGGAGTVAGNAAAAGGPESTTAGSGTTLPRPALFADLPLVDLVAPVEAGAGRAPVFEWKAVAGAASYRLSVLAPDAPSWAWLGAETRVRYGGVSEGVNGPSLRPGSWWSVAALTGNGTVTAMSDLRAVSPADDRGPAPAWIEDSPATGAQGSAASASALPAPAPASAAAASPGGRACDLLTADEIGAAIKGSWGAPELTSLGTESSWCDWTSANGTVLSVMTAPASQYDPTGWDADGAIDDLGAEAYRVDHGWARRIGFVRGEFSVMLVIDFTKVDTEGFATLARLVDSRLP
jgi:hypothetical protein